MFKRIKIRGLGPIIETDVVLNSGVTVFERPSQWGKSTLASAICFALWGTGLDGKALDVDVINDAGDDASVQLITGGGAIIERRITRNRQVIRLIQPAGDAPLEYKREEDFAKALKAVGAVINVGTKVHKCRLVLAPFGWRALALGRGNGRPLRDFLAAVLPTPDVRPYVSKLMADAGGELRGDDALDEGTVETLRREARRAVAVAEGIEIAANSHRDDIGGDEAPPASKDRHEAAQVLRIRDEWIARDALVEARNEAEQRAAAWQARRDAIPAAANFDAPAHSKAIDDRETARNFIGLRRHERDLLNTPIVEANNEVVRVATSLKTLTDEAETLHAQGGKCPTCAKTWAEAGKRAKVLKRQIEERETAGASARAEVERLNVKRDSAELELDAAQTRFDTKAAAVEAHADTKARHEALMALGRCPPVMAEPAKIMHERPHFTEIEAATALKAKADAIKGAADARARARERAKAGVIKAETAHTLAKAKADRLDVLLDAVRAAPSLALSDALAVLNVGGVEVVVDDKSGLDVRIDGRAWSNASTGRQVAADAALRNALRKAAGVPWFPLVIDNVQAWSGVIPEIDKPTGPVIVLRTVKGEGADEII